VVHPQVVQSKLVGFGEHPATLAFPLKLDLVGYLVYSEKLTSILNKFFCSSADKSKNFVTPKVARGFWAWSSAALARLACKGYIT
jgi:hypothetical protein